MAKYLIYIIAGLLASLAAVAQSVPPLGIGYGKLAYPLPEAGTYDLPVLGYAENGKVLNTLGESIDLYQAFGQRYVLLSFIFSACNDINGCPLSSQVSYKIKSAMRSNPKLAEDLKLVSISFDPEYDTPEIMHLYGENFKYAGNKGQWSFLTTDGLEALQPILKSYRQDIQRRVSVEGGMRDYAHILRVFLIDPNKQIRNIYSVEFLHSDIILNDLATLVLNEKSTKESIAAPQNSNKALLNFSGAGDNKTGYDQKSYVTRSKDLVNRVGVETDLLKLAQSPPLGLPKLPDEVLKQLSIEKIKLGKKLFFDRRLSLNETVSCAMCHVPEQGFTNNELQTAIGFEGRSVRRNSPTIYNVAYAKNLFHDGRENSLEQQIWGPLLARAEMANPSIAHVINKIKSLVDYNDLFEDAFNEGVNMLTLGEAFAAYQRTLVSANSRFDRWYFQNEEDVLNEDEQAGFKLFMGKGGCVACHHVSEESALFVDSKLHNTGLGVRASLGLLKSKQTVQLAPGVFVEVDRSLIDAVSAPVPSDVGAYEVTQNPDDRWKYKTPTLRNIALTAPYMHNGSLSALEDVVRFYNQGGGANELLDPLIKPLNLNEQEISQIAAFMQTLTGSNVDILVADAFTAPVGDRLKKSNLQ